MVDQVYGHFERAVCAFSCFIRIYDFLFWFNYFEIYFFPSTSMKTVLSNNLTFKLYFKSELLKFYTTKLQCSFTWSEFDHWLHKM